MTEKKKAREIANTPTELALLATARLAIPIRELSSDPEFKEALEVSSDRSTSTLISVVEVVRFLNRLNAAMKDIDVPETFSDDEYAATLVRRGVDAFFREYEENSSEIIYSALEAALQILAFSVVHLKKEFPTDVKRALVEAHAVADLRKRYNTDNMLMENFHVLLEDWFESKNKELMESEDGGQRSI